MEKNMPKLAIVTDSTAYIPDSILAGYPISVAPLLVIWDDQSLEDGLDITPAEFYARLKQSKTMPSTSQVTPATFTHLYKRLLDEGYEILCIHLSSKLSGTLDSAIQAKKHYPDSNIELFDSLTSGMALGFQVLAAARAAQQGATLKDCLEVLEKARKQSGLYFVPSTLEYLHRGGRIGGASAFLGSVLDLKPILTVTDGRIEAVEKVRTFSKAVDRMLELFQKHAEQYSLPVRLAALYTDDVENAQILADRAKAKFGADGVSELLLTPVSPVIGTHLGPGASGICFLAGM
jgi:DegV family protein with EDD domain